MSKDIHFRECRCAKGQSAQGDWVSATRSAASGVTFGRKHWKVSSKPVPTGFKHLQMRIVDRFWTSIKVASMASLTQGGSCTNGVVVSALFPGAMFVIKLIARFCFLAAEQLTEYLFPTALFGGRRDTCL